MGKPRPLFDDEVQRGVVRLRTLLGMVEAAQAPCVRATGYDHRYCCIVHADPGAEHGDFPLGATRCRAWPIPAPAPPDTAPEPAP